MLVGCGVQTLHICGERRFVGVMGEGQGRKPAMVQTSPVLTVEHGSLCGGAADWGRPHRAWETPS